MNKNNNENRNDGEGRERGEWVPDMRTDGWHRRGGDPRRNPFEREWRPRGRLADERLMRAFFAGAFWSAAAAATLLFVGAMMGAALAAHMGWRI